jgi:hypothetical protein
MLSALRMPLMFAFSGVPAVRLDKLKLLPWPFLFLFVELLVDCYLFSAIINLFISFYILINSDWSCCLVVSG